MKYCYVNVRHLPRFFDYSTELSYSKTERVTNIDDIQHPAIRNAMKMLDMEFDIAGTEQYKRGGSSGGQAESSGRYPRRDLYLWNVLPIRTH